MRHLTPLERRVIFGTGVTAILALLFILISGYFHITYEAPREGGSFTEGVVGQPVFINPLLGSGAQADRDLIEIIFPGLSTITETIDISENGKNYLVKLKKGARFSDGAPITAKDLIFTVKTMQNPDANHTERSRWQNVAVEKINEDEARFSLGTTKSYFLEILQDLRVAPAHVFESIPVPNLRLSSYNLSPIGYGPYAVKEVVTEKDGFIKEVRLAVNKAFAERKPNITDFSFRYYTSEMEAIAAFQRREIDGYGTYNPQAEKEITVDQESFAITMPRSFALFFNQVKNPVLQNVNVRKALLFATNREEIVEKIFQNSARVSVGPIGANVKGFLKGLEKQEFSLEQANKLLDEAGFKKDEKNGRMKVEGKTLTRLQLTITYPEIGFLKETVELLAKNYQAIGFEVALRPIESQKILAEIIKPREYEALLYGIEMRKNPDLLPFFHSDNRVHPGSNLALYSNPQVDTLLTSLKNDTNEKRREEKLKQVQENIQKDLPALFLFSPDFYYFMNKSTIPSLSFFIQEPRERFSRVADWYQKTARVFQK